MCAVILFLYFHVHTEVAIAQYDFDLRACMFHNVIIVPTYWNTRAGSSVSCSVL